MARKKGKEKDSRAALLDAAWQLLLEKGAAGMSVDAIVARAELSKGTFFHFFPAKQDLLDALCARIADESWRDTAGALARSDLDPVARLDRFLGESRAWRSARSRAIGALWQELARDDNAALMVRARLLSMRRLRPALEQLLAEGDAGGCMQVADVEAVAELVVEWMFAAVEGNLRLLAGARDGRAVDFVLRRANAALAAIERVLHMDEGSLRRVDRRVVSGLAADLRADDGARAPADRKGKGGVRHGAGKRKSA